MYICMYVAYRSSRTALAHLSSCPIQSIFQKRSPQRTDTSASLRSHRGCIAHRARKYYLGFVNIYF